MLPFERSGRQGRDFELTVPIFEVRRASDAGVLLWILACAGVHASVTSAAADGFSVMPSGSLTIAAFTCEVSMPVGLGS